MPEAFVFIDESGNDDFSGRGTRHFVLTSLVLGDIMLARDQLFALRHELLLAGVDVARFHASDDRQAVRDRVFAIIEGLDPGTCRSDAVVFPKRDVALPLQRHSEFYPRMVDVLLKRQFAESETLRTADRVTLFVDRPSQRGEQFRVVERAMRRTLSVVLKERPYQLFFHPSAAHHGLQLVDYISWAIYIRHERAELRPHRQIQQLIRSESIWPELG